ncbi:hypothetical protein CCUS01_02292 [Colletotrichum cuscutae]|uniref:Uncharacterized protein n=1 Tax=Colletotrichum cuscutae TaxID=1209917 RepID=A0AAI9TVN6_9PEZI|nr:hypothetical protein CCUS01_02292 [Colletotrichum cuscutae]
MDLAVLITNDSLVRRYRLEERNHRRTLTCASRGFPGTSAVPVCLCERGIHSRWPPDASEVSCRQGECQCRRWDQGLPGLGLIVASFFCFGINGVDPTSFLAHHLLLGSKCCPGLLLALVLSRSGWPEKVKKD